MAEGMAEGMGEGMGEDVAEGMAEGIRGGESHGESGLCLRPSLACRCSVGTRWGADQGREGALTMRAGVVALVTSERARPRRIVTRMRGPGITMLAPLALAGRGRGLFASSHGHEPPAAARKSLVGGGGLSTTRISASATAKPLDTKLPICDG